MDDISTALAYDPFTGIFTWRVATKKIYIGQEAGWLGATDGYIYITYKGKGYSSHRLAFLLMTGAMPTLHVDHINGVKTDNRWSNLREVTRSQQQQNLPKFISNTSGLMGVYWSIKRNRWIAEIKVEGKHKALLQTKDFFEACCARKSAERKYNYSINHGRQQWI